MALSEQLQKYAELLRGSPHNLLSPRALQELESRHLPESVAFAAILPAGPRLLDVGSGGGLPGLVIAIERTDLQVHLLEATRKKATFLAETVSALGLGAVVHHGRAEELASGELRGTFDIVTARAVAPLERLVPWCAPFLRPGGQLHAIKGERWAEELEEARSALGSHGLAVVRTPARGQASDHETTPRVLVLERTR